MHGDTPAATLPAGGHGAGAAVAGWVERGQAWLGTLVRIGVCGVDPGTADAAIDRGFAEIARVHALMSFHEPASDVGRLNREAAAGAVVAVDRRTAEVLQLAASVRAASGGAFDISVAPQVVSWDFLPVPPGAPVPDPGARGTDVEIDFAGRVRFRRPLWIDLGGIAKGYAVDAALRAMAPPPSAAVRISAGGDLRVAGPAAERVLLRVPGHASDRVPVVELADGALASSTSLGLRRPDGAGGWIGVHVDGRSREAAPSARFATAVAPDCALADALTKVVLALGEAAGPVLEAFGAGAYLHEPGAGWRTLGVAA